MIENLTKIPLHEVLLDNGYFIKRDKNSQDYKALTNANDDLVIISKHRNGDYLYFNPKNDADRGNIINFCKNRGIKPNDLLNGKNIVEFKDNLKTKTNNDDKINSAIEKYKKLEILAQSSNYFTANRKIDINFLNSFATLKIDNYQSIAIPTYYIKKDNEENTILSQSGFIKYLKTPITHDQHGRAYEKPLKQLCYGAKGLEIIKPKALNKLFICENNIENKDLKEIKNIILCESSIDSLSLAQINNFNADKTLICATNGQFTQTHKETLEFLKNEAINAEFILGFDNDEAGKRYKEKVIEILPNAKILKPVLKDFNDDLIVSNTLKIEPNQLDKSSILNKIIDIDKKAQEYIKKHNFLTPLGKEEKLKELREYYKTYNQIKPKIQNVINLKDIEKSFNEIINIQNNSNYQTR